MVRVGGGCDLGRMPRVDRIGQRKSWGCASVGLFSSGTT